MLTFFWCGKGAIALPSALAKSSRIVYLASLRVRTKACLAKALPSALSMRLKYKVTGRWLIAHEGQLRVWLRSFLLAYMRRLLFTYLIVTLISI